MVQKISSLSVAEAAGIIYKLRLEEAKKAGRTAPHPLEAKAKAQAATQEPKTPEPKP